MPGNVLITDTGNDRVMEAVVLNANWDNPEGGPSFDVCAAIFCGNEGQTSQIGIPYEIGGCNYSRTDNMFGPTSSQRIGCGLTVVVSAGRQYYTDANDDNSEGGSQGQNDGECPDNRVMVFDSTATRIWTYGTPEPGSGPGQLNGPTHATVTEMSFSENPHNCAPSQPYPWVGDIVITDSGNNRVIVVNWCTKEIVWSFGPTSGRLKLRGPFMTQVLGNGNILITDTGNHRVLEINRTKHLVGEYNSSVPLPLYVSRVDWTWLNNVNTEADLIGSELITEIEDDEGIHVNALGKGTVLFTQEEMVEVFGDVSNVTFVDVIRFRDRTHFLITAFLDNDFDIPVIFSWDNQRRFINFYIDWQIRVGFPYGASVIGDYLGLTVPPYFPSYDKRYCGNMYFTFRDTSNLGNNYHRGNICGYNII